MCCTNTSAMIRQLGLDLDELAARLARESAGRLAARRDSLEPAPRRGQTGQACLGCAARRRL